MLLLCYKAITRYCRSSSEPVALQKNRERADKHEHRCMIGNVLLPPWIRRGVSLLCPLFEVHTLLFFGRSFFLFVNHSPISFHKHVHASGLLNEGCSIICCVAAHAETGVFILIFAICYEWGRLLCVLRFWSWFPSWLIKGYFSSAICSTQCNKHFSVVHFCLKKNQSFANMHCLGNVMHSGFDPVPFLSHSCFWYGRESSPIV